MTSYTKGMLRSEFKRIGQMEDSLRREYVDKLSKQELKSLAESNSMIVKQSDKNLRFDIYVLSKEIGRAHV